MITFRRPPAVFFVHFFAAKKMDAPPAGEKEKNKNKKELRLTVQ